MRVLFCFLIALPALAQSSAPAGAAAQVPLSTLKYGGLERTYRLYRPSNLDRSQRAPLVFVLHGAGGTSAGMISSTGFNQVAGRKHFLVAYVDGYEKHWNDLRGIPEWATQRDNVDDVGFFAALIGKLVRSSTTEFGLSLW